MILRCEIRFRITSIPIFSIYIIGNGAVKKQSDRAGKGTKKTVDLFLPRE